ncbi:MAG: hypothetical protein HYV32_03175 [Candidatus Kerfeldbacteria bacterium]|nr:hypothetical protein [Candidatus Kerfeldbacteria bacterium]
MPKKTLEQRVQGSAAQRNVPTRGVHRGRVLMEWSFPEYERHQRGLLWYIIALTVSIGLLVYAVRDGNFLFALMILLVGLILFTHHRSEPLEIPFIIYDAGIQVGGQFFLFRELQSFSIIYEPPVVKTMYLIPKRQFIQREFSIPLYDQNPLHVRSLLIDFIDEDLNREEESTSDTLARLLKL